MTTPEDHPHGEALAPGVRPDALGPGGRPAALASAGRAAALPTGAAHGPVPAPLPTPSDARSRIDARQVPVPDEVLRRLADACPVASDDRARHEAARDWWPLTVVWAHQGAVPCRPAAVARPGSVEQVAAVLAICNEARVPVTTVAGRSGVCGGTLALHGGVALDLCGLAGIEAVHRDDLLVDVAAGTFGDTLESALRSEHWLTLGHWPQSMELSTVGGWLACRSAGQYSTRYGKIEDLVAGLDVVLADGRTLRTDQAPRAAVGPDLTQLFVGSEGTLGVITGARLRVRPLPPAEARDSWVFASFAAGLQACRRILRRGATPAVLRLYDTDETQRSFGLDGNLLVVIDEADAGLLAATMDVVEAECRDGERLGRGPADQWFAHRNDVSALGVLADKGYVVDTMEIAGPWSRLADLFESVRAAITAVPHALMASCHQSHAYPDGACLYFTFAGQPPADEADAFYRAAWDAGTRATLDGGGVLSHHHGVGLNRARFLPDALGRGHEVLVGLKRTLDPHGILNPGKLGLPDPFGQPAWP